MAWPGIIFATQLLQIPRHKGSGKQQMDKVVENIIYQTFGRKQKLRKTDHTAQMPQQYFTFGTKAVTNPIPPTPKTPNSERKNTFNQSSHSRFVAVGERESLCISFRVEFVCWCEVEQLYIRGERKRASTQAVAVASDLEPRIPSAGCTCDCFFFSRCCLLMRYYACTVMDVKIHWAMPSTTQTSERHPII